MAQLCRPIPLSFYLRNYRHISITRKNVLNSNISPTFPHNMMNFGPLTAEIGSVVWGTPANFNGFRVLASLLQRRRSLESRPNFARCLAVSSTGTLHIHFSGLLPHNGILPGAKFTLKTFIHQTEIQSQKNELN